MLLLTPTAHCHKSRDSVDLLQNVLRPVGSSVQRYNVRQTYVVDVLLLAV